MRDPAARRPASCIAATSSGDAALGPICQAWGGARALKNKWSNEAGSTAASDHRNLFKNGFGGTRAGEVGTNSVRARLMLAHMAQKSLTPSEGLFCGGDRKTVAALLPAPLDSAKPTLPRSTWPKESVNCPASTNSASHVTPIRFDLNQCMRR